MTDQALKKLNRQDLLRLLLETEKENERLRTELADAREQLEKRQITVSEAGNLADASLRLNGVFEAAQHAADAYLQNAQQQKIKAAKELQNTRRKCHQIEKACREDCDRLREGAKQWAEDYKKSVVQRLRDYAQQLPDVIFDESDNQ